jgi:hypothetical protein
MTVSEDVREPLVHNAGNAATGGIWRVTGARGSSVLKIARPPSVRPIGTSPWQTSNDPTHWNYWRREVLAYTSGLAGIAYRDAGIEAPALLETVERPDGSVELWLADVSGVPAVAWSPERLGVFARQLGAAQARWVDRIPDIAWLSRDWLPQYLTAGPAANVRNEGWEHPLWPSALRTDLRRLWDRRDDVLARALTAPRTLCHLDVWPMNLIGTDPGTTLLDWSFTGIGGIGEDAANLIVDCVTDGLMDAALLPQIDAAVTDGYVAGLHDGGWSGRATDVRAAIRAYGAAKYSWFAPHVLGKAVRGDNRTSTYNQETDRQAELRRLGGLVTLLAAWAAG